MSLFGSISGLALSLSGLLFAQTLPPAGTVPNYSEALKLLQHGSLNLDSDSLSIALQVFKACPSGHADTFSCSYRAAQVCLFLTRALDLENHRDRAKEVLTEGDVPPTSE